MEACSCNGEGRPPPASPRFSAANGVRCVALLLWRNSSENGNHWTATIAAACKSQDIRVAISMGKSVLSSNLQLCCRCSCFSLSSLILQLTLILVAVVTILSSTLSTHSIRVSDANISLRSDSLWAELDRTGVKAVLIRFCGGQHLDHITAYSSDNTPVLELCRSDPRQVCACGEG